MIVVQWIFSHPKSKKIIQRSFDLFAAYFCEVQINAGSSVDLDAEQLPEPWNTVEFLEEKLSLYLFPD